MTRPELGAVVAGLARQARLLRDAGVKRWLLSCRHEQQIDAPAAEWSARNGMDLEVIHDPAGSTGGMLEALRRGLRAAGGQTLVVSVDMPRVTAGLVSLLWEKAGEGGCFFSTAEGGVEPFPGLYAPAMLEWLAVEGKSLKAILATCLAAGAATAVPVPVEVEDFLANWNRPGDVAG